MITVLYAATVWKISAIAEAVVPNVLLSVQAVMSTAIIVTRTSAEAVITAKTVQREAAGVLPAAPAVIV